MNLDIDKIDNLSYEELKALVLLQAQKIQKLHLEKEKHKYIANQAEFESRHDRLTGVPNRRGFDKFTTDPNNTFNHFVLIAIDLDNFKSINDTYGHNIGDVVLKHFSDSAKNTLRSSDFISRFGGEEFFILLTDSTKSEANIVLKKIANQITKNKLIVENTEIKYTFSAGAVDWNPNESFEEVSKLADSLLYKAKENGRKTLYIDSENYIKLFDIQNNHKLTK